MFSSTYNNNNTNPCSSILSNTNGNSNYKNNYSYQPANCYRPLQQLYKTVYSPMDGKNSSTMNIACICRPAERYKTTNMTYGSFYYDNSLSTEKNQAINYDKAAFARCYDNNRNKLGYQTSENNRGKDTSIFSNVYDPQESQYWTQSTNDACCPIDCCNNTSFTAENCVNKQNSTPYYSANSSTTNKSSNVQVRCV